MIVISREILTYIPADRFNRIIRLKWSRDIEKGKVTNSHQDQKRGQVDLCYLLATGNAPVNVPCHSIMSRDNNDNNQEQSSREQVAIQIVSH